MSYAQSQDWNTAGNAIIGNEYLGNDGTFNIPVSFENHHNGMNSEFRWSTDSDLSGFGERMRLSRRGFLGVNTISPLQLIHVRTNDPVDNVPQTKGILLTDDFIGNSANDGLLIGLNSTSFNSISGADISWRENSPLTLRQNALQRIILTDVNWGATTNLNRVLFPYSGFAGGGAVGAPFSMLHAGISPPTMQRNWMNVGLTLGTNVNSDMMHIGLLEHNGGLTDAVVSWGCQAQGFTSGPDNLRFLFLTSTALGLPASAQEGLETARITPGGQVGIGDFSNASGQGVGSPNYVGARLDIDGDLRIRTVTQNDSLQRLLVIDPNDHNRVHWLNIASLQNQCDWTLVNSGQDLAMGYSTHCADKVGIGTSLPFAKLDVQSDVLATGVSSRVSADNQSNVIAVDARASLLNTNQSIFGVRAGAYNNKSCQLSYNFTYAYGVHATANNARMNYAIYAHALPHINLGSGDPTPPSQCTAYSQSWAGYFNGATFTSAGNWSASDENLKTGITEIDNASEILNNIQTATYTFNHEAYPGIALPGGQHWGVMAQQLEDVAPSMVATVVQPAQFDEQGNQMIPEYEFKAVNYQEFTPILIAGHKEQQATLSQLIADDANLKATIENLNAKVDELAAMIALCCAAGGASDKSLQGSGSTGSPTEHSDFDLRIEQAFLGQNSPNPFQYETSITYRIPQQAMVRVRVMDAKSQQVDLLVDGLMPKGEYKIVWNASHLPSGLYFYTLEGDGVELVKKAVKL